MITDSNQFNIPRILILDVPAAPDKPTVKSADKTDMVITWSPPESDGGAPITSYVIEMKEYTASRWSKATTQTVTETELSVPHLVEGKKYQFRVAAVNKAGQGAFSEPSEPRLAKSPYG